MNKKLLFLCHSVYSKKGVFDPNHSITFGFLSKWFPCTPAIRHSLLDGGESRFYPNGIENDYKIFVWLSKLNTPLRYIGEFILNLAILIYYKPKIVLAIDPLSALAPALLRKIGIIRGLFFITPDFSERRFENFFLNWVYYRIDGFCTQGADLNFCVSIPIIEKKIEKYSVNSKNFFHLPNIPNSESIALYKNNKKNKGSFVYVGNISTQIDFTSTIKIVKAVQGKFPEVALHMVGDGDFVNGFDQLAKVNGIKQVVYHGLLTHEATLEIISHCEFGIALYNGSLSYDKYRDSCKIREYQALSCIPIASKVVKSNTDEILRFGSGLLIEDVEAQVSNIIELISNVDLADRIRENCRQNYLYYSGKFEDYQSILKAKLDQVN
jgi:glycosyltransferase involved in cell wall biosynthesis